ncbi:MAG: MarR family transcriptional regulator [Sphingomonadales bacterium]|nr:MarR family transcriptional regulator [Sphingomonadales bacterium]
MSSALYLLSDTARLLRRAFDARVGQLGMTSTQARLLLTLSHSEGENQVAYAERLEVEPITLCRLIDRMADSDLIERRPDPADRRAWRIHLTARSRQKLDEVSLCLVGLEDEVLVGLDAGQRDTLSALLETIRGNIAGGRSAGVAVNG